MTWSYIVEHDHSGHPVASGLLGSKEGSWETGKEATATVHARDGGSWVQVEAVELVRSSYILLAQYLFLGTGHQDVSIRAPLSR